MAIEILDASKRIKLAKEDMRNIRYFEALIEVGEENIKLTMKMGISKRNKLIDTDLNALGLNSMNLPVSIQGMTLNY